MGQKLQFHGTVFEGYQYFPEDALVGDIGTMRKWALKEGAITEPELQLITQDTITELEKVFDKDDELLILVNLNKDDNGKLVYFEYPFVPVKTLIKKGLKIKLVYLTNTTVPAQPVNIPASPLALEVKFGFWIDGSKLEYASATSGKLTIQKFDDLFKQLESEYPAKDVSDRVGTIKKEIEVDGSVSAVFSKSGRTFDVQLTSHPRKELTAKEVKANVDKLLAEGKFESDKERAAMEAFRTDLEEMERQEAGSLPNS